MAVHNNCPGRYLPKHREDVLRNGLKFENDRKFKNQLILKAILLMTVLLVIATCGFVTWSKLRGHHQSTTSHPIQVTTIIRKVPFDYDLDLETATERAVLPDVRTEFVPSFTHVPATHSRVVREVASQQGWNSSLDYEDSDVSEEIVWVQVSDKTKRNVADDDKGEPRSIQTPASSPHSAAKPNFWTGQGTAESIRQAQAQKMSEYMDVTAEPCKDFYQYACGRWGNHNSIPEDRAGFDTFEMLRDSLDSVLKDLLLEPDPPDMAEGSAVKKAKTLYRSCMDEETLGKRGTAPLRELLNSLGGWPVLDPEWNETDFDWANLSAKLRLYYNDILMTHWIGPDMSSSNYIIQFDQTNLGLSTRDHFLKDVNKAYRKAYMLFIQQVAQLLGANSEGAAADAALIVEFETALANITSTQEERRNISDMYEKMTLGQLEAQMQHIPWRRYLTTVLQRDIDSVEPVVLYARNYYMKLGHLLHTTPPRIVASYLMWRFVKHRINNLDFKFQDVKQEFLRVLFGREKSPPRWHVCVHHINGNMGMALGSMFVQRYFDENSKNDTVVMTQSIMATFRDMLEGIAWIDDDTRQLAKDKVRAIILRIGYPDFILDPVQLDAQFANVTVAADTYFENTLNVLQFVAQAERNRLGTIVDKKDWNTPPAIVNAYYNRNKNQIMFPAGILQPPFYHRHFPRSLNYGGIGVVIGHEIIHGFDDKGRLYDLEGNLNRWWKEDAINGFHKRAKCLIDQYNAYTIQEIDMRVDGVNTQGENIADNGGIKQAFQAYEKWVNENGDANETLPGINATNYQLFFVNFAQVWCGAMRPEASRNKIQSAVHPPGKFRVIGTVSNSEEFARVFNCPKDSSMNPPNKCRVW